MATVQMTRKAGSFLGSSRNLGQLSAESMLRMLAVERSDEILPILLEEIVNAGYPSALAAKVDFESGQLRPVAALHCSRSYQQKFKASLYAHEHPAFEVLQKAQPRVVPEFGSDRRAVYVYPFTYRSATPCWEAERERGAYCLALANQESGSRLRLEDQTCATCKMEAWVGVIAVELADSEDERAVSQLQSLLRLANLLFSRRFKVEHYYNRMTDLETTIQQQGSMMAGMSDPVVLTDVQHRVIMQNKAAESFFKAPEGVSEGHIHAVELNNLLFSATLSSLTVSASDMPRDVTLVDPTEGEELLFEAVSRPVFSREGMRSGMVTVLRDVTDLRRADEELRANYEKLRAAEGAVRQERDRLNLVVENVGDPIIVCDSGAVPVFMDRRAQELFGDENHRDAAQARNLARFNAYVSGFTYSFLDRQTGSLRLETSAGVEIEFDVRSGKIYDDRGQAVFTVSVLRDLTAIRTVEQLKMEQRMLQFEKFAAAGRLAGTIAHELNNPMEAVKNAIFLLADAVEPPARPVYDILVSETDRVMRIVRQMLGLYRSGEQVGNVDLNSIVQDTLALFGRQLQRASIRLTTELGQVPELLGSADQLRRLLSNLVLNARDSMPQGGQLRIRTYAVGGNSPEPRVRMVVADTGSGIPPGLLHSIFEPFVTTKGEKGTGLGLWIVKGVVENHGGKVSVRSKLGQGTVFRIELPIARVEPTKGVA